MQNIKAMGVCDTNAKHHTGHRRQQLTGHVRIYLINSLLVMMVFQLVERAANYTKMYVSVGVGLAVTVLEANRPESVINRGSAIVSNWVEVKADSVLSVSGTRSNESTFSSSMEVEAAALNITSGTKVNIIVSACMVWCYTCM